MNWKRGFFRIWILLSACIVSFVGLIGAEDFFRENRKLATIEFYEIEEAPSKGKTLPVEYMLEPDRFVYFSKLNPELQPQVKEGETFARFSYLGEHHNAKFSTSFGEINNRESASAAIKLMRKNFLIKAFYPLGYGVLVCLCILAAGRFLAWVITGFKNSEEPNKV